MYNAKYIWLGIVVFLGVFAFPFWSNFGTPAYKYPDVAVPAFPIEGTAEEVEQYVEQWKALPQSERMANPGVACIEPRDYMRAEHMQILDTWRDQALRQEKRVYVATDGTKWEASLQNTCMQCHVNKEEFCDTCHNTNSVDPYCWDCHVAPRGNR